MLDPHALSAFASLSGSVIVYSYKLAAET